MSRTRLAILTHAGDRFRERHYLIKVMIPHFEALGVEVVVASDEEPFVPADLALLHVDLSVVPESCRRLAERYPRVLNGNVLDIRKRSFSTGLVTRSGPDPGPVIVKTDWNCGGRSEFRRAILESRPGRWLRPIGGQERLVELCEWVEARRPWPRRHWIPTSEYRTFEARDLVPEPVFRNPNLIVERFLAEREGDCYCCRHWVFLGDRERKARSRSLAPAVKGRTSIEPLSDPVPEELVAIRRFLGFDYGKFDYGIVDGRLVLYDVNRTPGISSDLALHAEGAAVLAPGLRSLLRA